MGNELFAGPNEQLDIPTSRGFNLCKALATEHEISLFGGICCIYAGYNYIRQLYDTLTQSSVMQCNTTKVIRAFKCNMMAKIHLRSDLCFISDANCHNSGKVKSVWFC